MPPDVLKSRKGSTEFNGPAKRIPPQQVKNRYQLPEFDAAEIIPEGQIVVVKDTRRLVEGFGPWFAREYMGESSDTEGNIFPNGFTGDFGPIHRYLREYDLLPKDQASLQDQPVTGEAGQPVAAEGSQAAQPEVK